MTNCLRCCEELALAWLGMSSLPSESGGGGAVLSRGQPEVKKKAQEVPDISYSHIMNIVP